ncbi:signal peptidase I [Gordonia aichiensis]|uniref:signal peptidase I n=1 Tax=Gordonia aichiensis TaxID=36820 RepID=UPI003262FF14
MISSRGKHRAAETQDTPDVGGTSASTTDPGSDSTPPIWWVKTIASYTLLAAAVALLAVLVVIPRLSGSTAYTVLTGSMTPTYQPGTLIVVKPTPGSELQAGDVITFQPKSGDPSVTTHRIISIVYDASGQRRFITKGDANNATDPVQLVEEQVRGRLLYSVPYLGRINSILSGSSRSILMFLIAGGLGAYALWMWISGLRDRKKPDEKAPAPAATAPEPAEPPTRFIETAAPTAHVAPPVRQAAPMVPTCHACGAPQSSSHRGSSQQSSPPVAYSAGAAPLAYSATTAPEHRHRSPDEPITQPITVYTPSSSHN